MMHNHPQDVGVTHWKPGSGKNLSTSSSYLGQGKLSVPSLLWVCHRLIGVNPSA